MFSPGGIIASNYEWNLNPTSGHHPGCLAQLNTESVFETLVLISISIAIVYRAYIAFFSMQGTSSHSLPRKLLGIVSSTVVGITFRFCAAADPNGSRVRALAKLLNSIDPDEDGMIVVLLRRAKNVPADCNAVSVVVSSGAMAMGAEALLQEGELLLLSLKGVQCVFNTDP
jgi:hypothetical protein